jgi:hypothetical protein
MAESPSHKFGQYLGSLLEALLLPELLAFSKKSSLYLDRHGERAGVRSGRKLTWIDKYDNKHDLDFVIEKSGSATKQGRPLAFIEVAWRRYTKHSKNKAQEIQGAILPIAEKYSWDKPFLGAVLAGTFTSGSLEQLRSLGFNLIYIPYESIVRIYKDAGIDIAFDESTPDAWFTKKISEMQKHGLELQEKIIQALRAEHRKQLDEFFVRLKNKLERHIESIAIIPLFGKEYAFGSVAEAVGFLDRHSPVNTDGEFRTYEVIVKYSNGDKLEATFTHKNKIEAFLEYAAS